MCFIYSVKILVIIKCILYRYLSDTSAAYTLRVRASNSEEGTLQFKQENLPFFAHLISRL